MRRYFTPILCRTGAVHQQPENCAAFAFTADFSVEVDLRGALDAPEAVPAGSLRVLDFERLSLVVAHVYRDGWQS